MMQLKVLLPQQVLLEQTVTKVIAEASNGSFCLRPRHVDFVAPLVSGLLSLETPEGKEIFVAVAEGTLVKNGPNVLVSTPEAVIGPSLGELRATVIKRFGQIDEQEQRARSALARLEADFVRRFIELQTSSQ